MSLLSKVIIDNTVTRKKSLSLANGFIGNNYPPGCEDFLYISKAEGESMVQPDRVANDFGWISVSFVGSHAARLYWTESN